MTTMPVVDKCATTTCSFNHGGCTAFAMTMGKKGCVTFVEIGKRGGMDDVTPQVGACKRVDCIFNKNLECSADAVKIGSDEGECLTYKAAA